MSKTKNQPLFGFAEKLEKIIQWVIIIGICVLGIAFNYDPVKTAIKEKFFPKNTTDEGVLISYLSLITAVLLVIVYRTGGKSDALLKAIDESKLNFDDKLFCKGTSEIYRDVDDEMNERRLLNQVNNVDILGYTLFSVSPKLEQWKKEGKLRNLCLNLHHLDGRFISGSPDIDSHWKVQLQSFLQHIIQFKQQNKLFLSQNNVEINLIPYSHIPAVHGFKLGNGSIYMSIAHWNENLFVASPHYDSVYIKISNSDKSRHALEFKKLFENWLFKAKGRRISI